MKKIYFPAIFTISGLFSSCAFSIDPADIAVELNNRFNSEGAECSDNPGYACSGILIHTNDNTAGGLTGIEVTEHGKERGTVSFSFLRKDLRINAPNYNPIWGLSNYSGIIMSGKVYDIDLPLFCLYALDADTNMRGGNGCGKPQSKKKESKLLDYSYCREEGVLTAEQMVDKYYKIKETYFEACSWSAVDADSFNEWAKIPSLIKNLDPSSVYSNTEVLLKEWSTMPQDEVPLEAYYYAANYKGSSESGESGYRATAQRMQNEYFKIYGKFIPVIKIDMVTFLNGDAESRLEPFIYEKNDQVVSPQ
ncbi:hypothetical protein RY966_004658 [Enterobacter kobei]|nr:hypothetical protein [Enterobacter kobei]